MKSLGFILEKPKQISYEDMTEAFSDVKTEFILNFTNNLIKITKGEEVFYFKEAKPHASTLEESIKTGVKDFFEEVVKDKEIEKKVCDSLALPSNMRRLMRLGTKNEDGTNFNKYLTSGDEKHLGFYTAQTEEEKKALRALSFYLYGEICAYKWNGRLRKGQLQTFTAVRTLGVIALSKTLGLQDIIADAKFVKIRLFNKEKYGILARHVQGGGQTDVPCNERKKRITPSLLHHLNSLSILDAISGDNDHRVGNYNVICDENGAYVCVISYDNDSPSTFLPTPFFAKSIMNCSHIIAKNGQINRVALDKNLALSVLGIYKKTLKTTLCDYLSSLQIFCVWQRVKRLKKAIAKTIKAREDFVKENNEWNEALLSKELSGAYGKTYLVSFVSDGYFESGLHDFDTL